MTFRRIVIGIVGGSVVGAVWLTLATSGFAPGKQSFDIRAFVVGSAIYSVVIAVIFLVAGVPCFLLSRSLQVRKWPGGLALGFAFGMVGSLAYDVRLTMQDLMFAAVSFGVSGVLAAAAFLLATTEK